MIYPTARAVLLIAIGAPVAVLLGAVMPSLWSIGIAWAVALLLLTLIDGLLAARTRTAHLTFPQTSEIGAVLSMGLEAEFAGPIAPRDVHARLAVDDRLATTGQMQFTLSGDVRVKESTSRFAGQAETVPSRRGAGEINKMWLRWQGPLGLAWRQYVRDEEGRIAILPNISAVRSPSVQLFLRDSVFGLLARKFRGEGSEFEALAEYQPGMDRRSIDWKGSARHTRLLAKEYDTERNNQIVFALDCGAAMCEPIDGLPRIDRAVSAALLTAYVSLKSGDKASLFSFAAKPEIFTPFLASSRNFHRLQREAAAIDYRHQETNYTLGLSTLSQRLQRRSLVIIFTDFTDPTSADLLIEAAERMIDRHLMLFVVLEDEELTEIIDRPPANAGDVARSVTAKNLLDQKRLVTTSLRHMGIDVIEGSHRDIGTRLINSYLKIKRRGSL